MKKFILLVAAILMVASVCVAQENIGARPIGMGGAFTGLADDANAIFLNPAGIGYIRGESAAVSSKISDGDEYTILGGVESTPFGSIGIGYVSYSTNVGDLTTTSATDPGDTSIRALNQTLYLSYARVLNEFMIVPDSMGRLSLGANLKFVSSRLNNAKGLANEQDSGINLDLAASFRTNDVLSWGFAVKNLFGGEEGIYGETESGTSFSAGVSGRFLDDTVILSLENSSIGAEVRLLEALAVRAGRDGSYNTAGVGVNLGGFGVDYAYLAKAEPVHYVGVSITIDRPEPDTRSASLFSE